MCGGAHQSNMITCPNCAAGNKAGSSVCRMCAVSLEGLTDAPALEVQSAAASSAAANSPREVQQEEKMPAEGIVCPECNTSNEAGWSFCQQCGKRLPKSPAPPSSGELRSARGLTTVPDQQAISDGRSAQDLNTVAEKSPAAEPSFKTVAEKSPAADDNIKTVAEKVFKADDSSTTIAQEVPEPGHKAEAEAPTPEPANVAEPPAESSSKSDPWADLPTVVTEVPLRPTAETPAMTPAMTPALEGQAVQSPPAPVPAPESTQHVQSVSGMLCSQCGQTSNPNSTFCANCGAPFTFGRTMVISSESGESREPAPPAIRGRLHLVMEGGQPGEVYELGDDTSIGRSTGQITFPHDGFMSGQHARIVRRGGKYALSDEGSRNGTFVKIKGEIELEPGDMILVGKQLFRFEV